MRTKLKWSVIFAAVIFAGLQFTSPVRTNPPVIETEALEASGHVPQNVSKIFARSCNDCHSNKTDWRWYTHIAPVSWFTVGHVNDGRAELNFSEWGTYSARMRETRLKAICHHCRQKTMPLASYSLMHGDVKLTPDEIRMICEWATEESLRIASYN